MSVNKRFSDMELDILKALIGQKFEKFRCDSFVFNHWVYLRVCLYIGGKSFSLTNSISVQDYFEDQEDICNLSFHEGEIESGLRDVSQIDTILNDEIQSIQIVSEIQSLKEYGEVTYTYEYERAVIFILKDGREVSFEKTDDFSEQIAIQRGHNLVSQISTVQPERQIDSSTIITTTRAVSTLA